MIPPLNNEEKDMWFSTTDILLAGKSQWSLPLNNEEKEMWFSTTDILLACKSL